MSKFKVGECPFCGAYGQHYWHHVFNGPMKNFSEKYGAYIYPCWPCHETNKDSIHNNAAWRLKLKQEHQARIMQEQSWDAEKWLIEAGRNYL